MSRSSVVAVSALLLFGALGIGCSSAAPPPPAPPPDAIDKATLEFFAAVPEVVPAAGGPAAQELIDLGRMLYFEPRLSKSQQISCNSCHDLATYGADGQPTSDGHKGLTGTRNSPTVYNAAGHLAQFWDGRAADVEEQAKGPVLNPVEMAMASEKVVVAVLESMPEYVERFTKAFPNDPNPITYDNMARAIGAFERRLMTPSRWDAFLKGDENALTSDERMGYNLFIETGCQTCHAGAFMGGNSYQRLGAVVPYPRADDVGRYAVTKREDDRQVFKVPSLRNVEKTAPYFHDGSIASLEAAVREMAEYQRGRKLSNEEVARLVVFLRALTGKLPEDYIKPPVLPKSTAKTPKPDLS